MTEALLLMPISTTFEPFATEGMENYVAIHTAEGRLITLMIMKNMGESLPVGKFLRIHKTYIISKNRFKGIEGNEIDMGKTEVPMSRNRRNEIIDEIVGR
jgi:DNA-binding LytR/AlgR family response regulator